MDFEGRTINEWRDIVRRYFEAEISDDEESALGKFLVSDAAESEEFDGARAVMGFAVAGRRHYANLRRAAMRRRLVRYSVAASVAIAIVFSGLTVYNRQNQCVAYIGGVKYTDESIVIAEMGKSMQAMDVATGYADVGAALGDIFGTIEENKD